ncbi:A-type potassium channel modulatory protein DPP6-like, partial [Saccoglossus kowalevskii]|uniref:Dipeptidyl aminopeptidase-like protein 6-like n=1 Tax=Saccoglossus kowalevskii TaxID=10224 RepID=A0ABM0LW53_SACKO
EILSDNNAIWWSMDGRYFCYATFDDTFVEQAAYTDYDFSVYDNVVRIPYPKAGVSNNPIVKLTLFDTSTKEEYTINPPSELQELEDFKGLYLWSVSWSQSNYFTVIWSNRAQNHQVVMLCQANTVCELSYEKKLNHGWLMMPPPIMKRNGEVYFTKLGRKQDSKGDFQHIAMVTSPK